MTARVHWMICAAAAMLLAGCAASSTPVPVTPASAPTSTTVAPATATAPGAAPTPAPNPPATATQPAGAPTATAQPTPAPKTTATKPNIVLLLTDDLDAAAIQFMPKLKALITDQGLTFQNYFVAMSLCCPSRATTLRGQYPHNTQILGNSLPTGGFQKFFQLGEEKSTINVWLQDAGYRTMLAGKYLNGYPDKSNVMYIPPGWTEWYSAMKGNPYSEYDYTLNENGKPVAYGKTPQDYGTDVYVGKAVDFIQRSAKDGKPFFVYLAPYAPHAPYTPAPRHANLFPGAKAPRTPNYNEADVSDKPLYIKDRALLTQKQMDAVDADYRKRLQALQAVDEGIESIVNTLKASGQLDNTYFFFTSDNGYHLGNHRQLTGKIAPYQEELRVTMIVRGPGVPAGKTLEHMAGNVDLAPTWADLAGAKAADFVDGRSLAPLMGANPPGLNQWRQVFGIENGPDNLAESLIPAPTPDTDTGLLEPNDGDEDDKAALPAAKQKTQAVPPLRGIRMQTMSYVEYVTGEKELYDIKADPYQLNNLAAKADPKLIAVLTARVKELANCKAAACRTVEDTPLNLP
jgi:N-acetylglucosamine-6-sulfatase